MNSLATSYTIKKQMKSLTFSKHKTTKQAAPPAESSTLK